MRAEAGGERERWRAPAKINLWLSILGRREDGYHEIDTALQAIDLADTVVLEPCAETGLDCRVAGEWADRVPAGEPNLAARAARLLADRTGHSLRLRLTIDKEIPPGAGLGGGSSDAAAVLVALARRFAVPDPVHTLHGLAAELGADVPFFLTGGTARAWGIGGELAPCRAPAEPWGILVWPGEPVATAWAYGAWDQRHAPGAAAPQPHPEPPEPRPERPEPHGEPGELPADWRERGNDFEPLVFDRHPGARAAAAALEAAEAAVVRLSGSGSAVYGLYASAAARDAGIGRVREALRWLPGARIRSFVCVDHGVRPAPEP